jgi:hypothetical protein
MKYRLLGKSGLRVPPRWASVSDLPKSIKSLPLLVMKRLSATEPK